MNKTTTITIAALISLSTIAAAGQGEGEGDGDGIVLGDGNSTATFDNTNGQYSWTVDGVEHLYAQEFYFRRSGFNDEQNLNTMTLLGQAINDTNPFSDDRADSISTLYSDNNGLEVETLFTLRGSGQGSGASALAEQITLTNTGTSTIFLSFFQYVDFDLGGDASDDWGRIVDGNTATQYDDEFAISETVATPSPTLFQMGDESDISALWSNGVIDNLNGDADYQGDVAWAFQWNVELEAGDSFLISKNKSIVPTPSSLALLASAGLLTTRRRRA